MSDYEDTGERSSLLASTSSSGAPRKKYSHFEGTLEPLLDSKASEKYTLGLRRSSRLDAITYSWHNINVWVGAEVKDTPRTTPTPEAEPDLEAATTSSTVSATSSIWPLKKKNGGVQSKQILKNVNGAVRPGELLAIMGASGAGKTTLLNVLTFRNIKRLRVSGVRGVNGVPVGPDVLTSLSAYVQQDDMFIGTLTVKEHLVFQALLRMHRHIPYSKRMDKVDEVIQEFGLTKCADTLIGITGRIKGISGGEMKRLAFASEVLTDPLLMFLDEPTSGLDSFMAQNVVEVLDQMAQKGKTIICTIHQPSSELYAMFDRILFMAEGRVAFLGNTKDAVRFFKEQGYQCPSTFNPADYFIQTLAIQPGSEESCLKTVQKICDAFDESKAGKEFQKDLDQSESTKEELQRTEESLKSRSPYKASWWAQFSAVLWRSWLTILREPMVLRVRILQTSITAIVLSIIYFGQELNQDGVMNINGALFLFLTNMTFQNVFSVVNVFCQEVTIFLREHLNGMYRTDVYFISKTLAELPLYIFFPTVFGCVCYYLIGLNPDVTRFLTAIGIIVLVSNVACSFGYMISCISPNITIALSLAAPAIIPLMIFGGFFLNAASVPVYFIWLKYLSWFKYGNEALLVNQWDGITTIECVRSNATCPASGAVVLDTLNFYPSNFNVDVIMLFVLFLGYRFVAFLALLRKTYKN